MYYILNYCVVYKYAHNECYISTISISKTVYSVCMSLLSISIGKTTLMSAIARYQYPELMMMKILLVDQHVEGDEDTPIEWCLRNDIERKMLLEEELLLTTYLQEQSDGSTDDHPPVVLPDRYKGCNIELCLQECYDQMELLNVKTAEQRAINVLTGLGFLNTSSGAGAGAGGGGSMHVPTKQLSGGWVMRASLASAIFNNPDLLLLDEVSRV